LSLGELLTITNCFSFHRSFYSSQNKLMVPINCKTITSIDGVALKVVELLGEWMKFPYAVGFFVAVRCERRRLQHSQSKDWILNSRPDIVRQACLQRNLNITDSIHVIASRVEELGKYRSRPLKYLKSEKDGGMSFYHLFAVYPIENFDQFTWNHLLQSSVPF
jgi:hypothetical protein